MSLGAASVWRVAALGQHISLRIGKGCEFVRQGRRPEAARGGAQSSEEFCASSAGSAVW